jgi:hypothetical protein
MCGCVCKFSYNVLVNTYHMYDLANYTTRSEG